MAELLYVLLLLVVGGVVLFWVYPATVAYLLQELMKWQERRARKRSEYEAGDLIHNTATCESGRVIVVRLYDDGDLCRAQEMTNAIYAVRHFGGKATSRVPVLAVWYIHGWRHSAREGDANLKDFKELIEKLTALQECRTTRVPRHVVGIYVAWNAALGPPGLDLLTFWNRKRAADRISQSAIVTKLLSAARWARKKERCQDDLTILIGHSFGARVLFSAISQMLIDEVQRAHPGRHGGGYRAIEGPADLVLLMNPAFEASMFTAFHKLRRDKAWEKIAVEQQPRLLTISSVADGATRRLFPMGQFVAFATHELEWTTLGNLDQYVTHDLRRTSVADQARSNARRVQADVNQSRSSGDKNDFWYDDYTGNGLTLIHRGKQEQLEDGEAPHWGNPFIVARTTRDIIRNHNDIWNDLVSNWVVGLIARLEAESKVRQESRGLDLSQTM